MTNQPTDIKSNRGFAACLLFFSFAYLPVFTACDREINPVGEEAQTQKANSVTDQTVAPPQEANTKPAQKESTNAESEPSKTKETANISGKVEIVGWSLESIQPGKRPESMGVSYWGVRQDGKLAVQNHADCHGWVNKDSPFSFTATTFKPRVTKAGYSQESGWYYQHENLPAGYYCFVFQWGKHYHKPVWVQLKPGQVLNLDTRIDTSDAGTLEVRDSNLSRQRLKPKVWINFDPSTEDAKKLLSSVRNKNIVGAFHSSVWSILNGWFLSAGEFDSDGIFKLEGMAPGKYRLYVSDKNPGFGPLVEPICFEISANQKTVLTHDGSMR